MTKIKEIVNRIYSGGTPNTRKQEFWNGNIKWLSSGETRNNFIYDTDKKITELGVVNSSTKLANKGSIVMACAGQGFTRGQVSYLMNNMYINQSVICIEPDGEKVDGLYLYYFLKNNYKLLRNLSNDHSSRGSITTVMLKNLEINFPSIKTQKRVSSILYSLDKKIELNNEINDNLHNLVNCIYSDMFKNKTTNLDKLGNYAKCILGGTPSRDKKEYWNGNINWINSGEVNKFRILEPSEKITELGLEKSSTALLPQGTTVIAITGATLGQVSRLEIDSCANQSVVGIIGNKDLSNNYIYLYILNNISDIIKSQTGGAQQHINKGNIEDFMIYIPSKNELNEFEYKVGNMFDKIALNCKENQILNHLRDILLQKLMNEQLNFDDIGF